ncbi:MAG: Fic family protein, partial [bacterium]|nr:Fic family protein [bacterium]
PGITNVAAFHAALYALHPFNNGNKRVCRILEHLLLRSQKINAKNLYSPSYYYHKEKDRYYKYLLATLQKHNLNYFVAFFQEAVSLSLVSVLKTAVEMKREDYLNKFPLELPAKTLFTHLIKQKKIQFKNLARYTKNKMARQTLVDYLQKAQDLEIITKEEKGRTSFYSLNLDLPEEKIISRWLSRLSKKLPYIPAEFST